MGIETRFLKAVRDFNESIEAGEESLKAGNRLRAIRFGVRAAGNALQRLVYGSAVTFDYVVNARLIELPPLDERLKSRYGYPGSTVALAAQMTEVNGEELPPSFTKLVEPLSSPK